VPRYGAADGWDCNPHENDGLSHWEELTGYPLVNIQKTMENHHFLWENPLFLWQFSIAMLNYQRVLFTLYTFGHECEFVWIGVL